MLDPQEDIDLVNKIFYGKYNFPWPPLFFPAYPPGIALKFLNQDIGCWKHDRIPENARIWVAGCGTNQAVFTALKFPQAEVLGTDISSQSLQVCKDIASQIGVKNLYLEEKSLNDIKYEEAFDYIICTGVIHHNANPGFTLSKISNALKRNGILELMVHNYYHRIMPRACQKAIRTFYDPASSIDMELELSLLKSVINNFQYNNLMGDFLRKHLSYHETKMVDSLLQPVEHSYTIGSLEELAGNSNLEPLLHCMNQFDSSGDCLSWNMDFGDPFLTARYNALPDLKRWQISNLLLLNNSLSLWFYFQRKDAVYKRKSEQQVCEEFLKTRFRAASFYVENYIVNETGRYVPGGKPVRYPMPDTIKSPLAQKVLAATGQGAIMKDVLNKLEIEPSFNTLNNIRIQLATLMFPFLLAVE